MAENPKEVPTDPALASAGTGEGEAPSKKGQKKAEAKAKKEAEKARKACLLLIAALVTRHVLILIIGS